MEEYIDITAATTWYTAPYDAGYPGWNPPTGRNLGALPWAISGVSPMLFTYGIGMRAHVPDGYKLVGYEIHCDVTCDPIAGAGASAFLMSDSNAGAMLASGALDYEHDLGHAYLSATVYGDAIDSLRVVAQASTWTGYPSQHIGPIAGYAITYISLQIIVEPIDYTRALIYTMNAGRGKWSRYVFPFSVDAFAQLGDDLYIRSGDRVLRVVEGLATDDVDGVATGFPGIVQWPWLDMGAPGATKMLEGFDLVASGSPSVSVGFDQRDSAAFTTPYSVDPDTLPGGVIPLPVMGSSFALRVDFAPGSKWSLQAANLYVDDTKGQP